MSDLIQHRYTAGDTVFEGRLALPGGEGPHPAVIVFPSFRGRSPAEEGVAKRLAGLGYAALAADPYGEGRLAADHEEASALMGALMEDRAKLQRHVLAALESLREHPGVDGGRIAATGYCFGGLCALDLARSGADLRGIASFHGLFTPSGLPPQPTLAKVVAFHGWDDSLASPETLVALGHELTAAGADWQIHAYGGAAHAFTNPEARAPEQGLAYHEPAARRSWASFESFLAECLA